MISTAFVLGAGLGTRLRPLTARRPKPLIPVCNKPLIAYAFDHLLAWHRTLCGEYALAPGGFRRRIFPRDLSRLAASPFATKRRKCSKPPAASRTWKTSSATTPFIVYNGDILSDLPLEPAPAASIWRRGNEVTLVLRSKDGPLQVAFDASQRRASPTSGSRLIRKRSRRFLFTGIYLVNPEFLRAHSARDENQRDPALSGDDPRAAQNCEGSYVTTDIGGTSGTRDAIPRGTSPFCRSPRGGRARSVGGSWRKDCLGRPPRRRERHRRRRDDRRRRAIVRLSRLAGRGNCIRK